MQQDNHKYEKVSMMAACVGVGLHQLPYLAVTASGLELHRALVTINNHVTHCCAAFIVHVRAPRTHDCFDWAKSMYPMHLLLLARMPLLIRGCCQTDSVLVSK
jgi:hypothetical protein